MKKDFIVEVELADPFYNFEISFNAGEAHLESNDSSPGRWAIWIDGKRIILDYVTELRIRES